MKKNNKELELIESLLHEDWRIVDNLKIGINFINKKRLEVGNYNLLTLNSACEWIVKFAKLHKISRFNASVIFKNKIKNGEMYGNYKETNTKCY